MLLKNVLIELLNYVKGLGISREDLYKLFFEVTDIELDLSQTAKNIFSKRTLASYIVKNISSDDGFCSFCKKIKNNYLSKTGCHDDIYQNLCSMIEKDEFLPEEYKKAIISSCDPNREEEVASLIALCILCGNYNTAQQNKKNNEIQTGYGINIFHFTKLTNISILEYDLWEASKKDFLKSRSDGHRFASFSIIQNLLPKGYITDFSFRTRGKTDDGIIDTVMNICSASKDNIAIVGDGGIGKTTFLHQLMSEEFLGNDANGDAPQKYKSGRPVPFL